jgi:hypothetical protein
MIEEFITNTAKALNKRKDSLRLVFSILGLCTTTFFAQAQIAPSGCMGWSLSIDLNAYDTLDCASDSNGYAALAITGGGHVTYWSTGAIGDSIGGLSAGGYEYLVYDSVSACWGGDSVYIYAPDSLQVVLNNLQDVSCYQGNDGSITVGFTGGNDTVSYVWSNTSINYIIPSLVAGSYTVTITDLKGCQDSATFVVNEPDTSVFIDSVFIVDAYCQGGEVGMMTVFGAGGTGPYNYAWNNDDSTATTTNLGAGSYVLTITDALGCTHDTSFTVSEPNGAASASITAIDVTCFGTSNGSMTASASGGILPYSYIWSNNTYTATNNNLDTGYYEVYVYDSVGCTWTASATITQPPELVASTSILNVLLCSGDSNGAVSVAITSGVMPYGLLWNTGSSSDTLNDLYGGLYYCVATDSLGCTDTGFAVVSEPLPLEVDSLIISAISCHGDGDGALEAVVIGGTQPYAYTWSSGSTNASASNLAAGNYLLQVIDSNGCAHDSSFTLTQPDSLVLNASTVSPSNCGNTYDGVLTANGLGGTSNYVLVWSTGDTIDTLSSLLPGTYGVTVIDAHGCLDSGSVLLDFINEVPEAQLSETYTFCNDSSGTLVALPGYASYAWTTGDTTFSTEVSSSGTYAVTINSSAGCIGMDRTTVFFENSTPFSLGNDTIVCLVDGSETVLLAPSPNAFAHFNWSTGDTTSSLSISSTGLYTLNAANAAGCWSSDTIAVSFDTCTNIGIEDRGKLVLLGAYPNPSKETITLEWNAAPQDLVHYTLYTAQGKLVRSVSDRASHMVMDIRSEASGIYLLRADDGKHTHYIKVIKE